MALLNIASFDAVNLLKDIEEDKAVLESWGKLQLWSPQLIFTKLYKAEKENHFYLVAKVNMCLFVCLFYSSELKAHKTKATAFSVRQKSTNS